MIMALIASGIKIPDLDPSSEEEDSKDHKMTANKNNLDLTKTIRGGNDRPGGPRGLVGIDVFCKKIKLSDTSHDKQHFVKML